MLHAALLAVIPATPDTNTIGRVGEDQRSCVLRNLRRFRSPARIWRLDRPDESGGFSAQAEPRAALQLPVLGSAVQRQHELHVDLLVQRGARPRAVPDLA